MRSQWISGCCGFVASHARRVSKKCTKFLVLIILIAALWKILMILWIIQSFILETPISRNENVCDNINEKIDYVWHLGARGETYIGCRDNVEEALDVNVNGTLNILKQAKRLRAKHFFFADTSAEYDSFTGMITIPQQNGWHQHYNTNGLLRYY